MRAALLLLLAGACRQGAEAPSAPRYRLACDSADTKGQSVLFCVRTETTTGDVVVLELAKLPVTSGSARAADDPAGTYDTVCDSTNTPEQADFRCVRLNTRTGDVVVLRLAELPRFPAAR